MFPSLRARGTTRNGQGFAALVKRIVWESARIVPGRDSAEWRFDVCGALMRWSAYGTTVQGGVGWEIDHIYPVARGGTDDLSNLQALQWENNRTKGERTDSLYCVVSLRGVR